MLSVGPGVVVSPFAALRQADPVLEARERAGATLFQRTDPSDAVAVAPLLVRLSRSMRSAAAAQRYAERFATVHGRPMWRELRRHADRSTRRWAWNAAVESGTVELDEVLAALRVERDQVGGPPPRGLHRRRQATRCAELQAAERPWPWS